MFFFLNGLQNGKKTFNAFSQQGRFTQGPDGKIHQYSAGDIFTRADSILMLGYPI